MLSNYSFLSSRLLTRDERVHLLDELLLLLRLEAVVPLGQAGLARAVLDQDELDRHLCWQRRGWQRGRACRRAGRRDDGDALAAAERGEEGRGGGVVKTWPPLPLLCWTGAAPKKIEFRVPACGQLDLSQMHCLCFVRTWVSSQRQKS